MPSPSAKTFGQRFAADFSRLADGKPFRELRLFRALQKALIAQADRFSIEEFHGSGSQVVFPAHQHWTKSAARCELSDLCIIWFRRRPVPVARITFLQAKISLNNFSFGGAHGKAPSVSFDVDSTQWCLLHRRPQILGRYRTFNPPVDLLSGALLPSVGSYGIFHQGSTADVRFFYSTAANLHMPAPTSPGNRTVHCPLGATRMPVGSWQEEQWCDSAQSFGEALYDGMIGTPIHLVPSQAPAHARWATDVRRWILGFLPRAPVAKMWNRRTIDTFRETFEIPEDEIRREESDSPAKSVIVIDGDGD
jgi:hypothetical protein